MAGDPSSQAQAQEDKQRQVEDMKNSILSQVLTQEARARCKYICFSRELHTNQLFYTHYPPWCEALVIHELNCLIILTFQ